MALLPEPFAGDNLGGHLKMHPLTGEVLVTNRGHDSIVTFAARGGGLRQKVWTFTGGASPRHFWSDGKVAIVAHEDSGSVSMVSFGDSDRPAQLVTTLSVPGAAFALETPLPGPAQPRQSGIDGRATEPRRNAPRQACDAAAAGARSPGPSRRPGCGSSLPARHMTRCFIWRIWKMRTNFDFTPYRRSTVGFDRLFNLLETSSRGETSDGYPPFDIQRLGADSYRITLAVAGFRPEDIEVVAQQNLLSVPARNLA